ncbi:hypothetical protein CR513_04381, partial [Mucuna pruriens]
MARGSFVLVFSLVLALPVLGQEDWKDLLDQGGFNPDSLGEGGINEDSFEKAQKAFDSAGAQAAVSNFFGTKGGSPSAQPDPDEVEGAGSSLADFLDSESNPSGVSPMGSMVDSPVGAPDDDDDSFDDDDSSSPVGAPEDSLSPAGAPLDSSEDDDDEPSEAPMDAPVEAPTSNASTETPELAPTTEAPELAPTTHSPVHAPICGEEEAPTNAPSGEPLDDDDDDDTRWAPASAPSDAPGPEPSDDDASFDDQA